jgi:hypothetical protein
VFFLGKIAAASIEVDEPLGNFERDYPPRRMRNQNLNTELSLSEPRLKSVIAQAK